MAPRLRGMPILHQPNCLNSYSTPLAHQTAQTTPQTKHHSKRTSTSATHSAHLCTIHPQCPFTSSTRQPHLLHHSCSHPFHAVRPPLFSSLIRTSTALVFTLFSFQICPFYSPNQKPEYYLILFCNHLKITTVTLINSFNNCILNTCFLLSEVKLHPRERAFQINFTNGRKTSRTA